MEHQERDLFVCHGRRAAIGLAAMVLAVSACSSESTPSAPPATTQGTTAGTTAENPLADAKSAVVDFFEAKAVNDYDKALARSSGAAALTVRWARDVNGPQATKGTPYEVPTVTAPNIRVQIDDLQRSGTDMWRATGFVELGFRPSGVASTTTTAAPGSTATADTNVFVTDLTFSDDGSGHLRLDDFRLDDTPYPVSQLYIAAPAGSSTTGTTAAGAGSPVSLSLAHRDLDGSVQYDLGFTSPADGTKPTTATFYADVATVPTSGATGSATTLYADAANAGATVQFLVVRPGAFPGGPGVLRVAFGPASGGTGTTSPTGTAGTVGERIRVCRRGHPDVPDARGPAGEPDPRQDLVDHVEQHQLEQLVVDVVQQQLLDHVVEHAGVQLHDLLATRRHPARARRRPRPPRAAAPRPRPRRPDRPSGDRFADPP